MAVTTLVVGGGIGGLSLARELALRKLPVTVLEKAPKSMPVGAGIIVNPNAMRVLERNGLAPALRAQSWPYLRRETADRRADVFSLGVVLWEALAHAPLFDGANDDAIKQAVLRAEFRPPSETNANVPAELDAICKKALARDPADRYQSAKVMAAELDVAFAG